MKVNGFLSKRIKDSKKAIHGGDVWNYFSSNFIDFSSNINPLGPPKKALDAIKKSMWKISYYPDSNSKELKKALANYLDVEDTNIAVGNGSTEIIKNFSELVIRRGNEVIIPEPIFSEYEIYSKLYGASINHIYANKKEDFEISKKIIDDLNKKTKLIFLCNPNNPTGKIMDEKKVEDIIEKAYDNDTLVFLDEAYIEFTDFKSLCNKVEEFDNLLVLRSLTKFFSLAGLRVGYGVGNKKLIECLEKMRPPWNVNVLAQIAAIESINDPAFIKDSKKFMEKERKFLFNQISKINGIKVYDSYTNFLLIDLRNAGIKAEIVKDKLLIKNMLIRDCSSFRGLDEYFVRVCIRKRDENIKLINAMKEVVGYDRICKGSH